jgi:uncharacterized protein with HEPN domain
VNQAVRLDPTLGERIPEARRIIALRNRLAHAYFSLSHELVWSAVLLVPSLREHATRLERELGA